MRKEELVRELQAKATHLRREALLLMKEMGAGWLGGTFSSADVVTALLFYRMKHDPRNPQWGERDRLIISKAHACELYYAALSEAGYFPKEDLKTYSHLGGKLHVHVDCKASGPECSGGSLGLGLSFAVGSAMGAYIMPDAKNLSASARSQAARFRVYCIVGDGECNEGRIWEAAENASHYRLDNLTAIIDHNKYQSTGAVETKMNPFSLAEKFSAFGWETRAIDGNNLAEVVDALEWTGTIVGRPQAIVAHTIKGKGIPWLEGTNCHFVKVTDELIREAFEVLKT